MKIIDFHAHLFPDDLAPRVIEKLGATAPEGRSFTDGTAAGCAASMRSSGIARSVILPIATKPEQVTTINDFQATLDRTAFIPFGAIHPRTERIDDVITFLKKNRIAGVKLHPEYQDFHIDAAEFFPVYEALAAAGIIALFHAGKDPGPFSSTHALPPAIRKVVGTFPDLTIVAAHMGGWDTWNEAYEQLCGMPVYLDTSAIYGRIDRSLFLRMLRKHGSEKILFGSDSPWIDQKTAREWIENLPLSDNDKERIFHLNAEELLSATDFSTG